MRRPIAEPSTIGTLEHWVGADSRFRSSIHIAPQDPQLAVAEINRLGPKPECVQVMMPAGSRQPFGHRFYHPIYEACQRHGPAAKHPLRGRGSRHCCAAYGCGVSLALSGDAHGPAADRHGAYGQFHLRGRL